MTPLPSGTVTFLFTDLEGSTGKWEKHPDAMRDALARHDAILRETVEAHDGHVVKSTGDGVHAVCVCAERGLGRDGCRARLFLRDVGCRHRPASRAHRDPHRHQRRARR
jgi:class 3 adenylate cyclase